MSSQQIVNQGAVELGDHLDALTLAASLFSEADALFTAIIREAESDTPDFSMIERLAGLGQREADHYAGHFKSEALAFKAHHEGLEAAP